MPEQVRACHLCEIGRDILRNLGADPRMQFRNKLLVNLPARGEQAGLEFLSHCQLIDLPRNQTDQTSALLKFDVVPFAIGHRMADISIAHSARKATRKIRYLVHDTSVSGRKS